MKIAFISTMSGTPWGGSEELWVKTAAYALDKGHDFFVSVTQWERVHDKIKNLQLKGAKVSFRDERYMPGLNITRKVLRRLKNQISNTSKIKFGALKSFKPDCIVISQAGTFDSSQIPELYHYLIGANIPYYIICNNSLLDGTVLANDSRERAKTLFGKAVYVIFTAIKTKEDGEKSIANPIDNTLILRNPFNLTEVKLLPMPSIDDTIYFACVGGVNIHAKGQDMILEVLGKPQWKNRNWQLNIFDSGAHKEYLEDLVKFYHLTGKVQFKGYSNDISEVWANHHLLVLPSRLESSPAVIVEAMLCGRPSVATDVGGVTEWVFDGKNGFVADAPNVKLVGLAMERAWENRDKWAVMGEQAFHDALKMADKHAEATLFNLITSK